MYDDYMMHGEHVEYYENGTEKMDCTYYEDKLHGRQTFYYNNGYVRKSCYWEHGRKVKRPTVS